MAERLQEVLDIVDAYIADFRRLIKTLHLETTPIDEIRRAIFMIYSHIENPNFIDNSKGFIDGVEDLTYNRKLIAFIEKWLLEKITFSSMIGVSLEEAFDLPTSNLDMFDIYAERLMVKIDLINPTKLAISEDDIKKIKRFCALDLLEKAEIKMLTGKAGIPINVDTVMRKFAGAQIILKAEESRGIRSFYRFYFSSSLNIGAHTININSDNDFFLENGLRS
ncbi:MAG: hypothetical protein PHU71_00395 [Candidatus Gracilibacteria bacterium]|nr:hypothetical protein [Candidatus Gracilibacteria bacterium]